MTEKNTDIEASAGREASEYSDLLYSPHFLPGRGRRGGSQRVGVIHAVKPLPEETCGDNFNMAVCGKVPGGMSLGWSDIVANITCQNCRKALGI